MTCNRFDFYNIALNEASKKTRERERTEDKINDQFSVNIASIFYIVVVGVVRFVFYVIFRPSSVDWTAIKF